jgi:hypothetical protein
VITAYPQPGKGKSAVILRRFALGFNAAIETERMDKLRDGPAAFYGVVGIEHLLKRAREDGREFYYLDNAYFDKGRGDYYRIGHNRLQHDGIGSPDWERFNRLGIEVKPWKRDGRNIIVCPQSDHFMTHVAGIKGGATAWLAETLVAIRKHSDRPIIVREWLRDKTDLRGTLQADLQDAWCLVTHMSAAANEAILAGVPACVTGECAATCMSSPLHEIEKPYRPDVREQWAAVLAGQQWTLNEIEDGEALRGLHAR